MNVIFALNPIQSKIQNAQKNQLRMKMLRSKFGVNGAKIVGKFYSFWRKQIHRSDRFIICKSFKRTKISVSESVATYVWFALNYT